MKNAHLLAAIVVTVLAGSPGRAQTTQPPDTTDRAELKKWLLDQFEAAQEGDQPGGSVIRCQAGKELEVTMEAVIRRIRSDLGPRKNIQFEARILKYTEEEFELCVQGKAEIAWLELEPADMLYVNPRTPHYRVRKTREAGEEDLHRLCETSEREENFLFIRYQDGGEEWIECGTSETTEKAAIDLTVMNEIGEKQSRVEQLSFYHHHPREKGGARDTSQTPSDKDIIGFKDIMKIIQANHPALLARLDFRVVTTTGMYVFRIEERVLGDRNLEKKLVRTAIAIDKERTRSSVYRHANRKNFVKANRRFAKKYSRAWMGIRFVPRTREPVVVRFKPSDAQRTGLFVRDTDLARYEVFHNPELKRLILRHPTQPVLYDEKGNRIGYVGPAGEYVLAPPPEGWPGKYASKITLDVYKQVEEKMLRIKLVPARKSSGPKKK